MPLLKTVTTETAQQDVAHVLNGFVEVLGEVPKPLLMLANSPGLFMQQAALIGYFRDHKNLEHGLLTCIRYLAAEKLNYAACIEFNGNILKKQGMTDSDLAAMVANPSTAPIEEKEVALLNFVVGGLENPDSASAADMTKLQDLGWQESDIIDAVQIGFGMMVHGRMIQFFQMGE